MSLPINPSPRCVYALPKDLRALDRLPSNPGRSSAVHRLVRAFGLTKKSDTQINVDAEGELLNQARLIRTKLASRSELERFHDTEYVDSIFRGYKEEDNGLDDDSVQDEGARSDFNSFVEPSSPHHPSNCLNLESFGLEHDCPPFPQMARYTLAVAGAALEISRELREDRADIGIVWDGGRHHAQRSCAAGFCYVNDAALAISELRLDPTNRGLKKLDRVMYLDILDIHHGDGVESAFWFASRILTVSAHFHDPAVGFYPSSGALQSSGPPPPSPAASHALNVPIRYPASLSFLCRRTILPLITAYKPAALVIQCGVDGLAGDPIGGRLWGFGLGELGDCLETIIHDSLSQGRKVLLLGGGGYHTPNVARAWTYFTSIALGRRLDLDTEIPIDIKDDVDYGPSYTLDIPESEMLSRIKIMDGDKSSDSVFENDSNLQETVKEIDKHILVIRKKYLHC